MKKRLRVIAILSLLCGFAAAGFGAWSYFHARTQAELSKNLQEKSVELDRQSDFVKGTPEENRLATEAQQYGRSASEMLASAKGNSQRAVIFGVGSIVLILASVATMMAHLKNKESDLS
jgi:flagellar basal body-associated protein FliL